MQLEKEMKTYERELPQLLDNEGKFALIHDEEIAGIWETYEDALKAGYEKYGLEPFLVKRIEGVEQVYCFTRDLTECPS